MLEAKVVEAWPAQSWRSVGVLLAVSGGADSIALLCAMASLKRTHGGSGRLSVAHFDHQLRDTSAADAQFVADTCDQLQLPLITGSADPETPASGDGVEADARTARYAFLTETALQIGARYVVTAHTADDQVETVLHRLLRGTAIAGLVGIPTFRNLHDAVTIARPMLAVTRAQVEAYLQARGQAYCIDETNADARYTRNRIRHDLLPLLRREFNPQVDAAILRLAEQAGQTQQFLGDEVASLYQQSVTSHAGAVHIACDGLRGRSPLLVCELLVEVWKQRAWPRQAMSREKWLELQHLLQGDDGCLTLPGNIQAKKQGGVLMLANPI